MKKSLSVQHPSHDTHCSYRIPNFAESLFADTPALRTSIGVFFPQIDAVISFIYWVDFCVVCVGVSEKSKTTVTTTMFTMEGERFNINMI